MSEIVEKLILRRENTLRTRIHWAEQRGNANRPNTMSCKNITINKELQPQLTASWSLSVFSHQSLTNHNPQQVHTSTALPPPACSEPRVGPELCGIQRLAGLASPVINANRELLRNFNRCTELLFDRQEVWDDSHNMTEATQRVEAGSTLMRCTNLWWRSVTVSTQRNAVLSS